MDIEKLIGQAEYDTTFTLGSCVICGQETWCGVRIERSDGLRAGKRFIHLCFRRHQNPEGIRQALEREGEPCTAKESPH